MKAYVPSCAAILAAFLLVSTASASDPADNLRSNNPIVKAVKKSIDGVVAIRIKREGEKDLIGSGVIVDSKDGLIVTNRHVTGGRKVVKVRLQDNTELNGQVIATDCDWDLALVRVLADQPLHELTLAPTSDLMLAEQVIAIGSPFGYDGTVSVGIISALNRSITMPNDVTIKGLIQTTAPINPGNSGGPLININGEVIGINVALRDNAQNIAFAINASMVKEFLGRQFKSKRRIDHGMKVEERVLGETGDRQRIVVKNASTSELKSGDEILAVGAMKVVNSFDLERSLWNKNPGDQVDIKVNRQGHEMHVMMTLQVNQGAGQVAAVSQETDGVNNPTAATNVRSASQR